VSPDLPENTRHDKRRVIVPFIRWARDTRLVVADLDERCVAVFLARPSRRRCKHGDPEGAALHQFLEHLRIVRVARPCRSTEPSPADALVRRYLDHLRDLRGLCPRSIEVYSPFVRAFVAAQQLPERVAGLDALVVRSYLLDHIRSRSVSFVKLLTAALRSFLRFYFLVGATATDLSAAVPPVRRWRFAAVPPFLTADEV